MMPFTREETELAISKFEGRMDRYILKVHQLEKRKDAFLLGCHELGTKNYYLLTKVNNMPSWKTVHENLMPTWWNQDVFPEDDFCQEDIDAAADYIASS